VLLKTAARLNSRTLCVLFNPVRCLIDLNKTFPESIGIRYNINFIYNVPEIRWRSLRSVYSKIRRKWENEPDQPCYSKVFALSHHCQPARMHAESILTHSLKTPLTLAHCRVCSEENSGCRRLTTIWFR
jgi:hypothetical protein